MVALFPSVNCWLFRGGRDFKYASIDGYRHEVEKKDDWLIRLNKWGDYDWCIRHISAACAPFGSGNGRPNLSRISGIGFNLYRTLRGRQGARAFFIQSQREDDREKKRRLLTHYDDLQLVFSSWSSLGDIRPSMTTDGSWAPIAATHLNAWAHMQGDDNFRQWAFEHIRSGYPELQTILDRLKALEDENNRGVLVFAVVIDEGLRNMLKTFPNLSWHDATTETNFYVHDQVLHAVYDPDALSITETSSLSTAPQNFAEVMDRLKTVADQCSLLLRGQEIARSDRSTLDKLVNEILKLRKLHLSDFQKLDANAAEQSRLILAIRSKATEIGEDIDYLEDLKGQCSLCKRFS